MKPNEIPEHDLAIVYVPAATLEHWPGNAQIGDVDKIAYSLRHNGTFAPLIVQASTRRIIKGNNTCRALLQVHGPKVDVPVIFLDVSDARAARMNVADNATSAAAKIDEFALRAQLEAMYEDDFGSLEGAVYGDADYAQMISDPVPLVIDASDLVHLARENKASRGEQVDPGEIAPERDNSSRERSTAGAGDLGVFVSFADRGDRDSFYADLDAEGYTVKRVG